MKLGQWIILNDGRRIVLEDKEEICLTLYSCADAGQTFLVPYPSAGYGGGNLWLSLSEKYLLFAYYSGESEEAYCLFRIEDGGLKLVYESGYRCGEGASYAFADNETFLVQALPASVGPWYLEDACTDADGRRYFAYGELNILDIQKGTMERHLLRVVPSADWDEQFAEAEAFFVDEKTSKDMVTLAMPWGEEALSFPLKETVIFSQ